MSGLMQLCGRCGWVSVLICLCDFALLVILRIFVFEGCFGLRLQILCAVEG